MFVRIVATGSFLPKKVVNNHDLEKILNTSDSWIKKRVGISCRHVSDSQESTSFMAIESAKKALSRCEFSLNRIGLIIVATSSSDYLIPAVSSIVKNKLDFSEKCIAFDVNTACCGFIHAIDISMQYILNGTVENALVIASERMSRMLDWKDRSTCVLFGDGSGSVVLSKSNKPGILSSIIRTDGSNIDSLYMENCLSKEPYIKRSLDNTLYMNGSKVFKFAVLKLSQIVKELLDDVKLSPRDINWFIPHQANIRILESISEKSKFPMSKIINTLKYHGNTSAASIPLALDFALRNKIIKSGETILSKAFGAGFTWGGFIIKI